MRKIIVSAPGKIHLSGEHSVVYGQPALLVAIDKRLSAALKQEKDSLAEIRSAIPIGAGLGSSAALAVALTGAVILSQTKRFDPEEINQIAYEMEREQHGHPSGGDNTVVTYGGLLRFQKVDDQFQFEPIKIRGKLPEFLLVNSGKPKESTGEMVVLVNAKIKDKNAKLQFKIKKLIRRIGNITDKMTDCFIKNQFEHLVDLIRQNERLLEKLGVVGKKAKKIIRLIEKIGGAAKICGAGGVKKGSGMLLAYDQDLEKLIKILKREKLSFMKIKLAQEGARIEGD